VARLFRRAACLGLVSTVGFAAWTTAVDARSSAQGARRTASQQLSVAIVIPRSGPFHVHNRLIANGATVAANQINATGSGKSAPPVHLKLSVVGVQPRTSPRGIVRGLVRASTRVLILPCDVELQEPLARAAAKAGLLALSPCNPDPNLAQSISRDWPTGASGSAEVQQLVFYAYYLYKHPKSAFLLTAANSWYSREMTSELRAFAKRYKIKIVGAASVSTRGQGVARLAQRIHKANPTVLFAAVPSPAIESIVTQLRNRNVTSPFFVTDGMDAGINFKGYQNGPDNSSIEDVVFATFGFPRPSPESARFSRDYAAAYGQQAPYSFPGLGYETVRALEAAAQGAAALTPSGLNASFAKGFTVKGVALGDITYRGHGHRQPVTGVGIAQVIRDEYHPLFTSVSGHPIG
jgi:ABC-type branched-subunit amino acid transport system substrate-binding protein